MENFQQSLLTLALNRTVITKLAALTAQSGQTIFANG